MNTRRMGLMLVSLSMACLTVSAQDIKVQGKVIDQNNEPVIGATVTVKDTKISVVTDIDGNFIISAPSNGKLVINYIGMDPVTQDVKGRHQISVRMTESENLLQDVVVVGYGVQKRGSITGSVAAVKGDEMVRTKNENPQNMLTGRVAGVRVWQKSAEPGSYRNDFDVRGMGAPLVIIDGVPREMSDFQRMNANDIEDISVLKDASASIYGLRAANGVVLVTTKKGSVGKTKVSYNGSYTIQQPKSMPKLLNAYQSMDLYNERAMNNVNGGAPVFTEDYYEAFRNGTRRQTNWNKLIFADTAPESNQNVTVSGGNEKTQYFLSFGYLYQKGLFKSGDLNYSKYNFTSNITTEIFRGMKLDVKINGMSDVQNNPYSSSVDIIRNYWRQGVLYPAYADAANTMLNYEGLDLEENAVAEMTSAISGYKKYKQKQLQTSATLSYDLGTLWSVLKGLSMKAMLSYDYRQNNNSLYRKAYYQYAYDPTTDTYTQKLYSTSSPSKLTREHYDAQQFLNQYTLNYLRDFGKHNVSAVFGFESQRRLGDNFYATRNLAFSSPYLFNGVEDGQIGNSYPNGVYAVNYNAFIGRVNYNYASRYLVEGQFRYDGSSQFAPGHRWGFFPSVSLGWVASEEPWFKKIAFLKDVDQLKFRMSYGEIMQRTAITTSMRPATYLEESLSMPPRLWPYPTRIYHGIKLNRLMQVWTLISGMDCSAFPLIISTGK